VPRNTLITAIIFLMFSGVARAGKHPVPLEPNADAATCVQCHENKTKGKSVHSAMQMGCLACHEIRVVKARDKKHEDITRVKLQKATPTGQCLSCHDNLKGSAGNSRVHAPVKRNCLTCHDPHTSAFKNQLKKDTVGERGENLCLGCHTEGLNVPPKGSRHAALDMGCQTCHVNHKTGEADKRENRFHLTKEVPALCLDCHDVKDESLARAHRNQPFASADCLTCHAAHASARPKLAQRFLHQPFESGACDVCHAPAKDGKVVLTQSDTRALCVTCHQEQAKKIESAKVQHPGAQGECVACHSPHASAYDKLFQPDPVTPCESCHSQQAEMHKKRPVLHKAAFRDGCYTCHDGHGGDNPKLLRAQGNRLCLECHSPRRSPKQNEANGTVSIFNGAVNLPGYYFLQVPALDLRAGDVMGHPIANHPVLATIDRSDPAKKRSMGCLSCHHAHSGAAEGMLVTDTRNSMPLCNRCHDNAAPPPADALTLAPVKKDTKKK